MDLAGNECAAWDLHKISEHILLCFRFQLSTYLEFNFISWCFNIEFIFLLFCSVSQHQKIIKGCHSMSKHEGTNARCFRHFVCYFSKLLCVLTFIDLCKILKRTLQELNRNKHFQTIVLFKINPSIRCVFHM